MNGKLQIFLLIWSQLGWLGCALMARWDLVLWTPVFPAVGWLLLRKTEKLTSSKVLKLISLALIGIAFDLLLSQLSLIQLASSRERNQIAILPLWLISMWFLFVCLLPLISKSFQERPLTLFFLGFIFGPLTYRSGEAFEILFLSSSKVLVAYAVFWSFYLLWASKLVSGSPSKTEVR